MLRHAKIIHKVLREARALIPLPVFTLRGLTLALSISTVWAGGITPQEVVSLANESRTTVGLSTLSENKDLTQAANDKANDMINNDYFAHTSPTGVDPWSWFKNVGYDYKYAGENLAVNYTNAVDQDTAWMNSTTHRANILNPRYQEIGVAVVEGKIDGKRTLVTVELFGSSMQAVADQVAPSPPSRGESVLVDAGIPLVKGVETTATMSVQNNSLLGKVTAFFLKKMSWLEFGTLVAVVLLVFSTLAAPLIFIVKGYESLWAVFQSKKREHVAVMT